MKIPVLITDKAEFQRWKDSPATREFLDFLRDWQANLTQAWASGQKLSEADQREAQLLGLLSRLEWEAVMRLYYPEWEADSEGH